MRSIKTGCVKASMSANYLIGVIDKSTREEFYIKSLR